LLQQTKDWETKVLPWNIEMLIDEPDQGGGDS
jgi:hypothetical protein